MDNFTDRSWNNYSQLACSELSCGHLNSSDLDLFVVVHLPLLLSQGTTTSIFFYGHGTRVKCSNTLICFRWSIISSGPINQIVNLGHEILKLSALLMEVFPTFCPQEYSDMIAERRKKVTSGQEDTYGMKTRL